MPTTAIATRRASLALLAIAAAATTQGCSNGVEGSLFGAGLGAGSGAIIGSLVGEAGPGAVIGAVAGALSGAVIGDQNQRNDRRAYDSHPANDYGYYDRAPRPYSGDYSYEYREHHYYRDNP